MKAFIFFALCVDAIDSASPLVSWKIPSTVLPQANQALNAEYNATINPDCIWVFGGSNNQNSVFCYNITNDDLYLQSTLQAAGQRPYADSFKSSVMIGENLFYITNTGYLLRYNVNTMEERLMGGVAIDLSVHE